MHPRQQHLVPLFVYLGAYQGKQSQNFKIILNGRPSEQLYSYSKVTQIRSNQLNIYGYFYCMALIILINDFLLLLIGHLIIANFDYKLSKYKLNMINHFSKCSMFICHGAGAQLLLKKQEYKHMYEQFKEFSQTYPNPKAILLYSAHWEQSEWSIIDHDNPTLDYDLSWYPPQAMNDNFKIGSNKELRDHVKNSLLKQGIKLKQQQVRGYDHGAFVPLMILYPEAKIPIIQMSILQSLDPQAHFKMGVALRKLKNQGFMVLGSGSSSHGAFREPQAILRSYNFDNQLTDICMGGYSQHVLLQKVKNWELLSHAKYLHPKQQHLIPLFVSLGASEGIYKKNTKLFLLGLHLSNYVFL